MCTPCPFMLGERDCPRVRVGSRRAGPPHEVQRFHGGPRCSTHGRRVEGGRDAGTWAWAADVCRDQRAPGLPLLRARRVAGGGVVTASTPFDAGAARDETPPPAPPACTATRGRRGGRPSGEPPPLPRQLHTSGKGWLLLIGLAVVAGVLI